jgi:hypothetical protein
LILQSRRINDESPAYAIQRLEAAAGGLNGRRVAVLGAAYRGDSEDTRNSPGLEAARQLRAKGCTVRIHDPYVRPHDENLRRLSLAPHFTEGLEECLSDADAVLVALPHSTYGNGALAGLLRGRPRMLVFDACNLFAGEATRHGLRYAGIGRGRADPPLALVDDVAQGFRAVEVGVANELARLLDFLNQRYGDAEWNRASLAEVRRLAGTCVTGCAIAEPGPVPPVAASGGFQSGLVQCALHAQRSTSATASD